MSVMLELKNVSKSFGKNKVLNGINLKINEGSVLGLMGENGAGKSTMMKIIFGIYSKDDGEIIFQDKKVEFSGPKHALENGIAMVHQELNQCLERNTIDNLFLGRYPTKFGVIDERRMKNEAEILFRKLGVNIDLNIPLKKMSVAQRQMIEISKAVSYDAKVIVLDEPTSSLTEREITKLFNMINTLKKDNISFVYISHKMDEIFEICDEISVLRDGQLTLSKQTKDTNMDEIITAMVGRSLEQRFPPVTNVPKEKILEISKLNTLYSPYLYDISLDVKKGEILGLYGLVGAGRSELLQTLFGLRTIKSGEILFNDIPITFNSAKDAMDYNFAYISEERKVDGLFLKSTIEFNTCIANLDTYTNYGIVSDKLMNQATKQEIKTMRTKCMSGDDLISSLSGGNQQKVIISRWLERNPDIFLLDEPTRGIDVGAKYEIYQLIIKMATEGKTCIVVSSEMPEILGITNRIAVMSNGRISGVVNTKDTNQEELMRLSAMYL